jgi:ATP-dependent Clp protease ATP-binding subunit ClpC
MVCSQQEAGDLESEFIGTEHLLLGLLATEGVARRVLAELGITHESVQPLAAVAESAHTFTTPRSGNIVFAPEVKEALEYSLREALQMGHSAIGTEHLLLGLLREEWNVGAQLIVSLGVEVSDLRSAIVRLIFSQRTGTT